MQRILSEGVSNSAFINVQVVNGINSNLASGRVFSSSVKTHGVFLLSTRQLISNQI